MIIKERLLISKKKLTWPTPKDMVRALCTFQEKRILDGNKEKKIGNVLMAITARTPMR